MVDLYQLFMQKAVVENTKEASSSLVRQWASPPGLTIGEALKPCQEQEMPRGATTYPSRQRCSGQPGGL
jgi:hypothetical protein